jgi:AhpD family alkylhydroperoxidase
MSKFKNFVTRDCLVPLIELEDFPPAYKALAVENIKRTGRLANSAKAMAHGDELALSARTFFSVVGGGGSLGPELALLIRLVVSNIKTCVYCTTHQIKALVKMGLAEEKIRNAHAFETHPAFSEEERVALAFAAALTLDSSNIPDDICERFQATFSPKQRVEITLVAGAMAFFNGFNDGLRVPMEDGAWDVAKEVADSFED